MFLGTPFRGSEGMDQTRLLGAAALSEYRNEGLVQGEVLKILEAGSETLVDLVDVFLENRSRRNGTQLIVCFYELKPSDVGRVVGETWMRVCCSCWGTFRR